MDADQGRVRDGGLDAGCGVEGVGCWLLVADVTEVLSPVR